MNLEEAVRTRRSVRAYTPDPVDEESLRSIVEVTRHAPSWANTQCVQFLAVRDRSVREALAETLSDRNPARDAMRQAPVTVAFVAREGLAGFKKGEAVSDLDWTQFDAGAAVQTFCLAAWEKGLGTVIVGYLDHRRAAEILAVPDGHRVVALTPLGRPAKTPLAPARRTVEDLLHFERMPGAGAP
jgi:nitroreductase